MWNKEKLKKYFLILYALLGIISFGMCFNFATDGNPHLTGTSGGAVAMGIIFSTCLYLIHSILFKSNK